MRLAAVTLACVVALPRAGAAEDPEAGASSRRAAPRYTAEQVKAAVEEHVRRTADASGGVYPLDDPSGKTVELELVRVGVVSAGSLWKVHDPARRADAGSYFACALFHQVGRPEEQVYDVDLLVEPRGGALEVTEVRLHKEKRLVRGEWVWEDHSVTAKRR